MSTIDTYLGYIASKRYAKDVRTAIVNAIRECYSNTQNPSLREEAFIAAIEAELENGHLTGLDLGDGDVTTAKIANSAVTTPKIADGAITQAKLDPNIEFVQVDDGLSNEGEAADAKATGDAISALNGSLDEDMAIPIEQSNYYDHLINYGYDQAYDLPIASGSGNQVGIKRFKTLITLNTSGANSQSAYIRLDGEMVRTGVVSDITNWVGGLPLTAGHIYEIVVRYLSGTSTLSNALYVPVVAARAVGTSLSPSVSAETVENEYHRTFEADDQNWLFFVNVAKNAILSNAKFIVTVCDLTASANALRAKLDDIDYEKTQLSTGNLFDYKTVTPGSIKIADGTIYTGGNLGSKYVSDYISVTPGKTYILIPQYEYASGQLYGMAYYEEDKTYISGAVQAESNNHSLRPWIFTVPNNGDIKYLRFSMYSGYLKKAYLAEYSWDRLREKATFIAYDGEPLNLTPFGIRIIQSFKTSMPHHQGGAVYGDKLFVFEDSSYSAAYVIDLNDGTLTNLSMDMWGGHNNTVGFTNKFYENGDAYPIIGVSAGESNKRIRFYRITEDNGAYAATLLSTVFFPSFISNHSYPECIVDGETNTMYIRSVKNGDTVSSDNLRYFKYNVPDQFDSDVTLESVPYSEEHPYGYLDIIPCRLKFNSGTRSGNTQDSCVHDNKIYTICGYVGSACLNVNDARDGRNIAWIDVSNYIAQEPEVCAYHKGKLIVSQNSQGILYNIFT